MRAHNQAMVWRQAHWEMQILPKPEECGWKLIDDKLVPVLITPDPIPKACVETMTCKLHYWLCNSVVQVQESEYSVFWTLLLRQNRE